MALQKEFMKHWVTGTKGKLGFGESIVRTILQLLECFHSSEFEANNAVTNN